MYPLGMDENIEAVTGISATLKFVEISVFGLDNEI